MRSFACPATNTRLTRRTLLGVMLPSGIVLAACTPRRSGEQGAAPGQITQPVTIIFQHRWEGVRERLVQTQVQDFAVIQPKVTIDNQLVFCSGGEGCFDGMPYDKILAQIAADQPPDVVMVGSEIASDWAHRGALTVIDDLLKRDRLVPDQVFYPALAQMARFRGQYIGLPQLTAGDSPYLFMNHETFRAAGLDPNRPPQSWDDLISYSTRLTDRQGDTFTRVGLALPGHSFQAYLTVNDGKVLSEDATRVLFDSPQGQETLQWMVDSTNRVYGSRAALDAFLRSVAQPGPAGGRVPWYQGRVGMWFSGVWHFFEIKGEAAQYAPNFQYSVSLIVPNTKNPQAKQLSLAEKVWLYAIPRGSRKIDAAWEWVKYITAGEGNKKFVLAQGRPSPAVKNNEDPEFARANPHWETVKRALSIMTPLPQTPAWPRIIPVLSRMVNQALAGEAAPREALKAAAEEAQRLLDEVRR
jgi:multiple sugar transport system substrate-binding protein